VFLVCSFIRDEINSLFYFICCIFAHLNVHKIQLSKEKKENLFEKRIINLETFERDHFHLHTVSVE